MKVNSTKNTNTILQNKKYAENQLLSKRNKHLADEGINNHNKNSMKINQYSNNINDNSLSEELQMNEFNIQSKSNAFNNFKKDTKHKTSRDLAGVEIFGLENSIKPMNELTKDNEETSESNFNSKIKVVNPMFRIQKNKEINIRQQKKNNNDSLGKNINIQNFIDREICLPSNNSPRNKMASANRKMAESGPDVKIDDEYGRRTFNINADSNPLRHSSTKTGSERMDRMNNNLFKNKNSNVNYKRGTNFKKDTRKSEDKNTLITYENMISEEFNNILKKTLTGFKNDYDKSSGGALNGNKFKMQIPKVSNPMNNIVTIENKPTNTEITKADNFSLGISSVSNYHNKNATNINVLSINNNQINSIPKNYDECSNDDLSKKQHCELTNKYNSFYGTKQNAVTEKLQRETLMKNFLIERSGNTNITNKDEYDKYKSFLKNDPAMENNFLNRQNELNKNNGMSREKPTQLDQDELMKPRMSTNNNKGRSYNKPWLANTASNKEISRAQTILHDSRQKYLHTETEIPKKVENEDINNKLVRPRRNMYGNTLDKFLDPYQKNHESASSSKPTLQLNLTAGNNGFYKAQNNDYISLQKENILNTASSVKKNTHVINKKHNKSEEVQPRSTQTGMIVDNYEIQKS